ncbi:uncharacterized protein LOC126900894 [Daktulosphaira vitifoliae]|uniref:uncharacterized protein LOC126900894 n=1 Tax=Daktulosphaira vitifoliae TaxID=58002 RepID=UPI0021AA1EB1|nr:uncharacterized protein LOC126900894 [Daktulosphaira vitifoliae]
MRKALSVAIAVVVVFLSLSVSFSASRPWHSSSTDKCETSTTAYVDYSDPSTWDETEQPSTYQHSEQTYERPEQEYEEPEKIYGEPEKVYGEPEKVYGEPAKVYGEPARIYGQPEKVYGEPAKVYGEPAKVYGRPEENYEVNEEISVKNNGRTRDIQETTTAVEPVENKKSGFIVDGENYRKYRVEEETADGFIVGEYGVVSHRDGITSGVRYTADSSISPSVIYDALAKFLTLKR